MRLLPTLAVAGSAAALIVGCGDDPESAPTSRTSSNAGERPAPDAAVPILMYHVINTPPPGTPHTELWVSRQEFSAQMAWLARRGYHAVTLRRVWAAWHEGGTLPSKPVVVSFDDGYDSHLRNALPVLRARRWPGVLNLQVSQTKDDLQPPEVQQLIRAGWELDAHTLTHPDLTTVDATRMRDEVAGARQILRRKYRVPVDFFCYPAGRYDERVIAAVRAAGYRGATTTEAGLARPDDSPFALDRIRVNGSDGVGGLAKNLAAAQTGHTPAPGVG